MCFCEHEKPSEILSENHCWQQKQINVHIIFLLCEIGPQRVLMSSNKYMRVPKAIELLVRSKRTRKQFKMRGPTEIWMNINYSDLAVVFLSAKVCQLLNT